MTLCSRGRSVLVLTLVFGLVTASIIAASASWLLVRYSGFLPVIPGSMRSLSSGRPFGRTRWHRPGMTLQKNTASRPMLEPADFTIASLQRRNAAQIGDDVGEVGLFQPRIIDIGHWRLERPPAGADAFGDGAGNFAVGPGADAGGRVRGDVGGGTSRRSLGRAFARRKDPAAAAQSGLEIGCALRPCRVAFHAMADGDEIGAAPDRI